MTDLDDKAKLVTEIQTVLRAARDGRNSAKLRQGAEMINSPAFGRLPPENQEDLSALYAEAHLAATGALIG